MLAVAAFLLDDDEEDVEMEFQRMHMAWKRTVRDMSDPFTMGDNVFRKHYRMIPAIAIHLIELLRPQLIEHEQGIPVHLQVLSVLRFLAEGSYQKGVAHDCYHPMGQSTFSKYLHEVVPAIVRLADEYIVFPRNMEERQEMSRRFEESLGFPGVIGAIDCTLPKIHTPHEHEEAYVNHNQDHSLNVQVVSDMDYNILNIRITNGSSNDKFVWRHSQMRETMYQLRNNPDPAEINNQYYLIGDGGYTPSPVLLTPCQEAAPGSPEFRYSDRVRRTRCRVEQTFGIWKQVFRCINGDRSLHYTPEFSSQIVLATAVLYNYLRHQGMPMPVPLRNHRVRAIPMVDFVDDDYIQGLQVRRNIILNHFA
ncbi:putative nuclease HARBI1 [Nasonia vitripennis]|uniref:DDE Tnp4 domain-containing protein n=1 Tax=Nasonia vitripennis TaxID=7425 RepID=A0A7M7T6Y3_NASVI|nr:putative nuclease HARBI1 [Nasonia vitripennis]XP_031778765.1 putative nuclease HARBI1 [Nasonia vitripennis]